MVFGKGYDNSLWLMISADKKNREELVGFIKNIPAELYDIIHEKISKYEGYVKNKVKFCDRDEKHLFGEYRAVNGLLYRYGISSSTGALELIAYATYNNIESVVFSMTLFPCEDYRQLDFLEGEYIGDFSYEVCPSYDVCFGMTKADKVRYRLIKAPIGYVVYYSSDNSLIKNKSKGVDLRRLPSEMYLQELSTTKKVNERVRSRKRI